MKKYLILLTLLISSHAIQSSQPIDYRKKTADEMLNILMGAHIRAFAVDNLFARPLNKNGLNVWNEVIHHINEYVNLNSKTFFGSKDKTLMNALNILNKIEFALIQNIETAQIAVQNKVPLNDYINEFQRIVSEAGYTHQLINLIKPDSSSKNNAKQILSNLAFTLKTTAQTSLNHLLKYR